MRRTVALLTLLGSLPGCFALEEIDKGNAILDQHGGHRAESEAPRREAEPAKPEEPGMLADAVAGVRSWWARRSEPAPVERDPDDGVVVCHVDGRTRYTHQSDCLARGGAHPLSRREAAVER